MSILTSLARAYAFKDDRAQPITTVRHLHLAERPMVCVPLTLAGEAIAPLAMLVGTDRDNPELRVVPQPRDRNMRIQFACELAMPLLHDIAIHRHTSSKNRGNAAAPQLWVPNRGGIGFLGMLGRLTQYRSTIGQYAVPAPVPTLGQWLTFFAERADYPGSSLLIAATEALGQHWATGQSRIEDGNLAAQLAWIDPPEGQGGARAALEAEDPLIWPPAGPATDPLFDREVLIHAIAEYDRAGTDRERRRAKTRLENALRGQLMPTWKLVWCAIDHLRTLPPGEHVASRWAQDVKAFDKTDDHVASGGRPQPKRPSAVGSARQLNWLERAKAEYDAQRAFDDPLVMAEFRLAGEAFAGTVTTVDIDRCNGAGRSRAARPRITVTTRDPIRLVPDLATELVDSRRPRQKAIIVAIEGAADHTEITLELSKGMGRGATPQPGSVPQVRERVCYSRLSDSYQPSGSFPAREETPWTHGGPPEPAPTVIEDTNEEWS